MYTEQNTTKNILINTVPKIFMSLKHGSDQRVVRKHISIYGLGSFCSNLSRTRSAFRNKRGEGSPCGFKQQHKSLTFRTMFARWKGLVKCNRIDCILKPSVSIYAVIDQSKGFVGKAYERGVILEDGHAICNRGEKGSGRCVSE